MNSKQPLCEPIAIVGLACRLPGGNTTPHKLWQFLKEGGIASNKVPKSRFNIEGHWDGSMKPRTMRPPGGMFLEDTDPADFDASFFEISRAEAISMDPNQRQMLEVVYEGLENAGIPLESRLCWSKDGVRVALAARLTSVARREIGRVGEGRELAALDGSPWQVGA